MLQMRVPATTSSWLPPKRMASSTRSCRSEPSTEIRLTVRLALMPTHNPLGMGLVILLVRASALPPAAWYWRFHSSGGYEWSVYQKAMSSPWRTNMPLTNLKPTNSTRLVVGPRVRFDVDRSTVTPPLLCATSTSHPLYRPAVAG